MPANLLASMRYNIIDECIRDKSRVYHSKELIEAVGDGLKEFGIKRSPAKRTIMGDIAVMKSGVLGYIAPIVYTKSDGYEYANPKFSIHHLHLPSQLVEDLKQGISLVQQLTKNEKLNKLSASLTRMRDYLHMDINDGRHPIIYFEHSLNEPGQKWLDIIYDVILSKSSVRIQYTPFDGKKVYHVISPAFIKEYNNRWYVFGYHFDMQKIVNLSLDRVISIQPSVRPYLVPKGFNHDSHFKHLFGVTIPDGAQPIKITFETTILLSKYMDTKPVHPTQVKIIEHTSSATYEIEVYDNYEIRSKFRSFGPDLRIVSPEYLTKAINDSSDDKGK